MAFAFMNAGFAAIDVHMTDLLDGRVHLASFVGLAACGGFSYGDVLGAGRGWAESVLRHDSMRKRFEEFFARKDTFTLGVCNGCQFLTRLRRLIPGADDWPTFTLNESEQYEARVCQVELLDSGPPCVFLHSMAGSKLPIATAHAKGRARCQTPHSASTLLEAGKVAIRYVDNYGQPTERYPANPNGSPLGIAGVRSKDGRVLAMMPHPERTILAGVASWIPPGKTDMWGDTGPWGRLFLNARRWVG
jgi:phosphoribosylformylglycinamidine synthase